MGQNTGGLQVGTMAILICTAVAIAGMVALDKPKTEKILNTAEKIDHVLDFKKASLTSSCDGIETYYTGTNLSWDLQVYLKTYYEIYSSINETNAVSEHMELLPPRAMVYNMPNYDCEDAAHAVMCLNSLYPNAECEPYTTDNHLGVVCFEKLNGKLYRSSM